jgi:hypothetical protein
VATTEPEAAPGPTLLLYRVVDHDPPQREDFLSDAERGVPAAPHETARHQLGMSVFARLGRARDLARWRIRKGYATRVAIAAETVDEGGPLQAEPSPPPEGHWTLWGDPDAILARATTVERWGDWSD